MKSTDELLGLLLSSQIRKRIATYLHKKGPCREMEIANSLKVDQAYISRMLIQLQDADLVKCLTPKKKAWKIFSLTDEGEKIVKLLK